MKRLLPIVEGAGDRTAVPNLIRRTLEANEIYDVTLLTPHIRGDYPKIRSNFENAFRIAIKERAGIIWTGDFDCDNCDCVADAAAELTIHASRIYAGYPVRFAFFVREFETFFLANPNVTRKVLGIPPNYQFPVDPESIRDAKGWLSRGMPRGVTYKPTVDQQKVTAQLDIATLRGTSQSFQHLERALLHLVATPFGDELDIA